MIVRKLFLLKKTIFFSGLLFLVILLAFTLSKEQNASANSDEVETSDLVSEVSEDSLPTEDTAETNTASEVSEDSLPTEDTAETNTASEEVATETIEEGVSEETTVFTNYEEENANTSEPTSILDSIENFIENIISDDEPIAEDPTPIEEEKPAQEEYEAARTYNKKIFVNKEAKHTCEVEVFKVDISDRDSTTNTITLTKEADISYEIEVGSIPDGFDIKFVDNDKYEKAIGLEENSVDIEISKKSSAPEGSYTIPFIYTQKGVFDSSVICQMNILNS